MENNILQKDNIVLIGMPAVGKSTVGVLLAKKTGLGFMDTDLYIQGHEKKRLSEIIEVVGMSRFCSLEEEYVLSVSCTEHVIATGGSVVYGERAMAHLGSSGVIVYLDVPLGVLKTRLKNLGDRGVVIAPGKGVEDLYDERVPLYRRHADIIVDCGDLSPDEVLDRVYESLVGEC